MNTYAKWFGRVLLLGVVVNLSIALFGVFFPNGVLRLFKQVEDLEHPVWPSFACLLLSLLSVFYLPAVFDWKRYRANACLAVAARFAGVTFFIIGWRQYQIFGVLDLVFGVLEAPLLAMAIRAEEKN